MNTATLPQPCAQASIELPTLTQLLFNSVKDKVTGSQYLRQLGIYSRTTLLLVDVIYGLWCDGQHFVLCLWLTMVWYIGRIQ